MLHRIDPGLQSVLDAAIADRVRCDRPARLVSLFDCGPELLGLKRRLAGIDSRGQNAAGGHHLDEVSPSLDLGANCLADLIGPVRLSSDEVAMAACHGHDAARRPNAGTFY